MCISSLKQRAQCLHFRLKGAELLKIDYAREHFKLLDEENVKYDVVDGYETLLDIVR